VANLVFFDSGVWIASITGVGIMREQQQTADESEIEPMKERHFDEAVKALRFRREGLTEACRAVAIDGVGPSKAEEDFGISKQQISRAVTRIQEKWDEICASKQLICKPGAFTAATWAALEILEEEQLKRPASKSKKKKLADD
jgi:hypothetical protein